MTVRDSASIDKTVASNGKPTARDVAVEWSSLAGDLCEWAKDALVNRKVGFGGYRKDEAGKTVPTTHKGKLTDARLRQHFAATKTDDVVGFHAIYRDDAGECWSRWVAVDIDQHDDEGDVSSNLTAALAWYAVAGLLGFVPILLDSNGKGGYHLILLFADPIQSVDAYQFIRWLTRDYADHGLTKRPECFPKQSRVTDDHPFGNWLRGPGRHHTRDHHERVWDGSRWIEGADAARTIIRTPRASADLIPAGALVAPEPRPRPDRPFIPRANGRDAYTDDQLARLALEHLGPAWCDEYDPWLQVGMSLYMLGDVGLSLWDWWSQGSASYQQGACEAKWRTFGEKGVKLGSLFHWATSAGWVNPTARKELKWNGMVPDLNGKASNGRPPSNQAHHEANGNLVTERPERFNRTDLGNAKRLVSRFGDRLRYCKKLGTWLVWSGPVWEEDASGEIYRLAKAVPQLILEEPSEGDDDAKAQRRWSHATEAKKLIDSMIALAWSEPGVPVTTEELNGDPWLLNVLNGTIELRTGLLRRHRQADLITKIAPVAYDPTATCPRFLAFLDRIMAGNQNLVGFLQRALGSALTGDVSDHALFFFYGSGRNGKGTLLELFTTLLGNYATTVDSGLITKKRNEDHPTGLTDLDGRRFVSTEEVEDGKELAEALVKKLTGGNRIKARRMRQDYYEFPPTHKLFLAANHEPEIRGSDEGIWSRVKLVPFSVFIPVEERVKNLHEMLAREEGPGILAWAVQGCLEWQRGGLQEPPEVQKATEAYRTDMDTIAGFLADRCNTFLDHETLKTQAREPKDALYKAYTAWADASGCEAVFSARKFGGELQRRGYDLKESHGRCYRLGLTLKGAPDFVPPEKAF